MRYLITLGLLLTVLFAGAQTTKDSVVIYTAAQSVKHWGETATVCGKVFNCYSGGGDKLYLCIDGSYPRNQFSAVILTNGKNIYKLIKKYDQEKVCVTGLIRADEAGKAKIELAGEEGIVIK